MGCPHDYLTWGHRLKYFPIVWLYADIKRVEIQEQQWAHVRVWEKRGQGQEVVFGSRNTHHPTQGSAPTHLWPVVGPATGWASE